MQHCVIIWILYIMVNIRSSSAPCSDGWFGTGSGSCLKCSSRANCVMCKKETGECTQCGNGFKLYDGICVIDKQHLASSSSSSQNNHPTTVSDTRMSGSMVAVIISVIVIVVVGLIVTAVGVFLIVWKKQPSNEKRRQKNEDSVDPAEQPTILMSTMSISSSSGTESSNFNTLVPVSAEFFMIGSSSSPSTLQTPPTSPNVSSQ